MKALQLAESPHWVFQGEGRYSGQRMLLLRVPKCTLNCRNCDSKHTWGEGQFSIDSLPENAQHIMITGGQPSLYQDEIRSIVESYPEKKFYIEDDGSISWKEFFQFQNIYFTFSPKFGNFRKSDLYEDINFNPENFIGYQCDLKFVISSESDAHFINRFVKKQDINKDRVWFMPEGITQDRILFLAPMVADLAMKFEVNFTNRMHIVLYGQRRMV